MKTLGYVVSDLRRDVVRLQGVPNVSLRDLIVFMDTRRSATDSAAASAEERNLLFWPASTGTPHPKHFLRVVESPSGQTDEPVLFVTLDVQAEAAALAEFEGALGARLRTLRGDRSRQEVAAYLGRHPNTIAKFERGDAVPDTWELLRLSRLYGMTVGELLDLGGAVPQPADDITKEFVLVPEYGVRASAGLGTFVDAEEVVGRFAFRRSWLDSRGIRPEALAVVSAEGDSMEPTVRDSDILLVDTSVQGVRADGIYLIEQAGELRCKRLQALVGGGVKIRSDNPKYETEQVSADQADLLRVVAKVVWIGGER